MISLEKQIEQNELALRIFWNRANDVDLTSEQRIKAHNCHLKTSKELQRLQAELKCQDDCLLSPPECQYCLNF